MGRLSAAIGRLVQYLFHPASAQTQVYIDDVALMLRGSQQCRDLSLAKVLYVLAAFGVQVAMEKGERGRRVQWIGGTFELLPNHVVLGAPEKMIKEVKEILESWTGKGLKELRSFLGKLAWIAGIIPRMRWTVAAMYAVLTTVLNEEDKELQRAKHRKGDQRPEVGFVAVKGLRTTVLWLRAAFEAPESMVYGCQKGQWLGGQLRTGAQVLWETLKLTRWAHAISWWASESNQQGRSLLRDGTPKRGTHMSTERMFPPWRSSIEIEVHEGESSSTARKSSTSSSNPTSKSSTPDRRERSTTRQQGVAREQGFRRTMEAMLAAASPRK